MCDCFKDLINAGLGRKSKDYIAKEKTKKKTKTPVTYQPEQVQIDGVTMGTPEPGDYIFERVNFPNTALAGITKAQLEFLEGRCMKSHASALRYLKRIRKRNNK